MLVYVLVHAAVVQFCTPPSVMFLYVQDSFCPAACTCVLTMPYVPNVPQLARFMEKLDVLQLRELHGLLHLGVPWVT